MKVLLIDDDHGPMDYYVAALRFRGFEVEQIDSADAAFEWLANPESVQPSIIVMDLMLPPGTQLSLKDTDGGLTTGIYLLRKCKERFPEVQVVVFTNRDDESVESLIPDGIRKRIKHSTKPFEFADLLESWIKE